MTTTAGTRPAPAGALGAGRAVSFIRFVLRFAEPGGVTIPGSPARDDAAPWGPQRARLLVDTDPWGRPHLPGTSLAGALREMVRQAGGEDTARELFGHLLPEGSSATEVDAKASLIWVLGSRPVDGSGSELQVVPTQIRASTAISRSRGAAENDTLRVEEVLPAGARFEIFLRWDDAAVADVERFAGWLSAWQPLIGRGTSRGRGRCAAEDVRYGTLHLGDPAGLLRWLTTSGPDLARQTATTPVLSPASGSAAPGVLGGTLPLARVGVRITGPLRIGSGEPPPPAGDEGQQVTPMFRVGGDYVVPATGLKGLIRSRAEFILRSVKLRPAPCPDQRCGTCWTCQVFGHGGGHDPRDPVVGARAAVRLADAPISDPVPVRRQHVAIDRFTGGAHPGLLYTVDALEAGSP